MANKLDHIAFIMDGNNRWSKKNNYDRYTGYKKGAKTLITIVDYIFENTTSKYVSAFALSKNNLNRSKKLISILKKVLLDFLNGEINNKINNKYNIKFVGDRNFLSNEINIKIDQLQNKKTNSKKYLIIYLNYSGKEDIRNAAYKYHLNLNKKKRKLSFDNFLSLNNIPDPDILIRTGGFKRLSDFIIFQTTFTELFFINKLWPQLKKKDIFNILNKYSLIERKFGL